MIKSDICYIKSVVLDANFYNSKGQCISDSDTYIEKLDYFRDNKVLRGGTDRWYNPKLRSGTTLYFKYLSNKSDDIFSQIVFKRISKHRIK